MPYGFNEDKSKYELEDAGVSVGTFTPNTGGMFGNSTGECVAVNGLAVLCGSLVLNTNYPTQTWQHVGTFAGVLPKTEIAITTMIHGINSNGVGIGGDIILSLDTDGKLYAFHNGNISSASAWRENPNGYYSAIFEVAE